MIKVADEIWIATSLLHCENPARTDFSVVEIIERAMREKLAGGYRPGLQIHASTHCVASKPPNPARHRMLSETTRGRRRLFRPGDKFHRDRKGGKIHPEAADLPPRYRNLLDWYENDYVQGSNRPGGTLPRGASVADVLRFAGSIGMDDLEAMKKVIERDCERIDPGEWQIPSRH